MNTVVRYLSLCVKFACIIYLFIKCCAKVLYGPVLRGFYMLLGLGKWFCVTSTGEARRCTCID